ncbi:hypothetical protein PFICI_13478 [Pestalotiopsis fici W106-1]|uniref:Uncharacterized protein n=1 Tax=Pestalotiopsis fici (strain W106-1 / CGMCC3.15140) TaxID=1229662 RepID=W3WMK6_PESFW|nr:uncharacterized protein PFICI_13478 [Pestalotiopsis fici W106-1]ETS74994.1 hypothetical protein PFICI_13478 [Pestalotiopsis fici W106-1]
MSQTSRLFTALIRTHHITSRKKLQRVKKAAALRDIPFVLVRYGGSPGIMYAEALDQTSLGDWVSAVHDLRYKDFQCVQKPVVAQDVISRTGSGGSAMPSSPFNEVDSVADFGAIMERKGLTKWFEIGMGYQSSD